MRQDEAEDILRFGVNQPWVDVDYLRAIDDYSAVALQVHYTLPSAGPRSTTARSSSRFPPLRGRWSTSSDRSIDAYRLRRTLQPVVDPHESRGSGRTTGRRLPAATVDLVADPLWSRKRRRRRKRCARQQPRAA